MIVGLVSCSATKLPHPAPARELYVGPLCQLALRVSERECDQTFILSAKYGLVELDQVIAPYDHRFAPRVSGPTRRELIRWGDAVTWRIAELVEHGITSLTLRVYAGGAYAQGVRWGVNARAGEFATIEEPMAGLGIGQRLRWLNDRVRHLEERAA